MSADAKIAEIRIADILICRDFPIGVVVIYGPVVCVWLLSMFHVSVVNLLLVLVLTELFFTDIGETLPKGFDLGDLMYAGMVLLLVITACRYLVVMSPVVPYEGTSSIGAALRWLFSWGKAEQPLRGVPARDAASFSGYELVSGATRVIVSVLIASITMKLIPVDPTAEETTGLLIGALRVITMGLVLLSVVVVANLLQSSFAWRKMTSSEAKLYVRSVFTRWNQREVGMIIRRQILNRQRRRK